MARVQRYRAWWFISVHTAARWDTVRVRDATGEADIIGPQAIPTGEVVTAHHLRTVHVELTRHGGAAIACADRVAARYDFLP